MGPEGFKGSPLFRSGNLFKETVEFLALGPDLGFRRFIGLSLHSGSGPKVVPAEYAFQGNSRHRDEVRLDIRVERRQNFADDGGLIVEIINAFDNLGSDRDLGLETFRSAEICQQTLLQRNFLFLDYDRITLFDRQGKMS